MTELVDQSLAALRLLHDALLVVLADAATELVVVHSGSVLPFAPETRDAYRVLDLEDALAAVQPTYARAVYTRALQQLLQELPQVDVTAAVAYLAAAAATAAAGAVAVAALPGSAFIVLVCKTKNEWMQVEDVSVNCVLPRERCVESFIMISEYTLLTRDSIAAKLTSRLLQRQIN